MDGGTLFLLFTLGLIINIGAYGVYKVVNRTSKLSEFADNNYAKPAVAFAFEPLTELATVAAAKFTAFPLPSVPKVFISPENYFRHQRVAFYNKESSAIYFKDTYVNGATPEDLADVMVSQLIHYWMHQYQQEIYEDFTGSPSQTYNACYRVASRLLGVVKRRVYDGLQ